MKKSTESNWYSSTICNISLDHYLNGPAVPLGSALNEEDAVRLVKTLGVDMVQHWSQHNDGKAVYPTKFSDFHESRDLLDFWSKVARKAGVRFCIYYSSLVNRIAAEKHPEWTQRKYDGTQYTRWNFGHMCTNSPFIDQYLLPQIDEMMNSYAPDAFWFDGDSWAVHPCWC
ncbi:MAG: alpha-L-fucosidase [Nitrososphaerales archaeon]